MIWSGFCSGTRTGPRAGPTTAPSRRWTFGPADGRCGELTSPAHSRGEHSRRLCARRSDRGEWSLSTAESDKAARGNTRPLHLRPVSRRIHLETRTLPQRAASHWQRTSSAGRAVAPSTGSRGRARYATHDYWRVRACRIGMGIIRDFMGRELHRPVPCQWMNCTTQRPGLRLRVTVAGLGDDLAKKSRFEFPQLPKL